MLELKDYIVKFKIKYDNLLGEQDIKKEWENELFEYIKQGGKITKAMFEQLDGGQQFYINKHYIIHGINIIE